MNSRYDDSAAISVPSDDAPWPDIWRFALTYNAYDRHDGTDAVAHQGNQSLEKWRTKRALPDDLQTARTALFFEQRRFHHFGSAPSGDHGVYIRALVGRIRDLAGGTVPGPPDPLP